MNFDLDERQHHIRKALRSLLAEEAEGIRGFESQNLADLSRGYRDSKCWPASAIWKSG